MFFRLEKDRQIVLWEIRETRSHRWYCYDHNGFCFAWSFMEKRAKQKLIEQAAREQYGIIEQGWTKREIEVS
jgi:hypothetical protein